MEPIETYKISLSSPQNFLETCRMRKMHPLRTKNKQILQQMTVFCCAVYEVWANALHTLQKLFEKSFNQPDNQGFPKQLR